VPVNAVVSVVNIFQSSMNENNRSAFAG
jgi:hypothetical protein